MQPDDEDVTRIQSASIAGLETLINPVSANKMADLGGNALPKGTMLGEFEVRGIIGEGGFGIVYEAWDLSLQRTVALKEYIPGELAMRAGDLSVTLRSQKHRETFDLGLKSFINEARMLASFDHPSLVKVYRFWQDRGTAFMAMPWYRGPTLKKSLLSRSSPPDEPWLLRLLDPLTVALSVLHEKQCYHRDIAPDNIILSEETGLPILLDFGAARRVIGNRSEALTVILKPGYAPIEQYAEIPNLQQGPWTDVYALAAVVHLAITGKTPPTAVSRIVDDSYVPLQIYAKGRYAQDFLLAIDRALAVRPENRTQTIDEFRVHIGLAKVSTEPHPSRHNETRTNNARAASSSVAQGNVHPTSVNRTRLIEDQTGSTRTKFKWLLVGLISASMIAGGFLIQHQLTPGNGPSSTTTASATSVPSTAAETVTVAPGVTQAVKPPTMTNDPQGPLPMAASESGIHAIDPLFEIRNIVSGQAADIVVQASTKKPRVRIGGDEFQFNVSSNKSGYLYILGLAPDGSLNLFFPNRKASSNRIEARQWLSLPSPTWPIGAVAPPGQARFLFLVSSRPRNFGSLLPSSDDMFDSFDTGVPAQKLVATQPTGKSVYAGTPVCDVAVPCRDDYGAALLEIEIAR